MNTGPILICYDGSEQARRAIRAAAKLFAPRRAIVLDVEPVLTVAETYAVMASIATGAEFEQAHEAEGLTRASEGADIASDAGFDASAQSTVAAQTWEGVLEVADEVDASAIVIGSHGLSGIRELFEESVSHDVTRHSRRPVLVVPPARPGSTSA
jgi:nucleotide-binding universal stress UspA family protein